MFFAIKHCDSLHRRKQDGSRVNTFFVIRIYVVFLSGYISGIDINEQQ